MEDSAVLPIYSLGIITEAAVEAAVIMVDLEEPMLELVLEELRWPVATERMAMAVVVVVDQTAGVMAARVAAAWSSSDTNTHELHR